MNCIILLYCRVNSPPIVVQGRSNDWLTLQYGSSSPRTPRHQSTRNIHNGLDTSNKKMEGLDMSKLFTVEGLVCVVTGGGTGIGLCIFHSHLARLIYIMVDISAALAQNGATVYIVGRRKEKLETAVKMHKSVLSTITSRLTGAHERKADSPCCRCHIQR